MSTIKIEPLKSSDLPAVATVHLHAFPSSALTGLGAEAVRRYYLWLLNGPHDVVALVAKLDGTMAGFCFGGVFRGALSGFLRANRAFLIRRVLTHPWLIASPLFRERLSVSLNILRNMRKKSASTAKSGLHTSYSFGILSIAVDPNYQGNGVGRALLYEAEHIAIQHDFSRMHLTVDNTNQKAISFYTQLGWSKVNPTPQWNGGMRKELRQDIVTSQ